MLGGSGRGGPSVPPPRMVRRPRAGDGRLVRRPRLCARRGADVAAGAALGDVAENLVSDFARSQIAGEPFDVASSDRHTVKPWLAGRTTVSADIVDLAAQGFPLAGGRVSVVDRIPAPTLVYRHNEHLVAVTELPLDAKGARGGPGGIETIDGYHVARWRDANLAYVAVSDADETALGEFVAAFRRARRRRGRARQALNLPPPTGPHGKSNGA